MAQLILATTGAVYGKHVTVFFTSWVRAWPCGVTMDLMGLASADPDRRLPAPVGAAAAVAEMHKIQINLHLRGSHG